MEEILQAFNPWWERKFKSDTIPREDYINSMMKEKDERDVVFITGIRRVGKTVIMQQTIERLLKTVEPESILYVSLDHPVFLDFSILDIIREHRKMHSLRRDVKLFLFLDEVHLKEGFERELKVLYDMEKVKIYASGSSSLVVKHKGAFLTGRFTSMRVKPLSFPEFLKFRSVKIKGSEKYLYEKELKEYMRLGGMPEYIIRKRNPQYLLDMIESAIDKDIVGRYGIRNRDIPKKLIFLLAERVGKPMTYNKLSKVLGVTPDTVKQYVTYFEETYLVSTVQKYAKSLNERIYSPKKVYLADVGIKTVLSGFKDIGSLAENLVFNELSETKEIFYFREGFKEIDFVYGNTAIEVKYKDRLEEDDIQPLVRSRFKKKLLITKGKKRMKGIETVPLVEFLMGNTIGNSP